MEITKIQALIMVVLGIIGGVLGSILLVPDDVAKVQLAPTIAAVDSTLLFYHREAVAELMGQPNAHQIAFRYRKHLPQLLETRAETKDLLVFDRTSVIGGAPDLTGALAEDYLQALDRHSRQGRGIQ